MSTKNKKLSRAAKLGKKIDKWRVVARILDRLCEIAMARVNSYSAEQNILLREITKDDILSPRIARI